MSNIFSSLLNAYQKTNKKVEQASLIVAILAFGALILYVINNPGKTNQNTDNIYSRFLCQLSAEQDLVELNKDILVTDYDLSLANIDTELFKTANSKNDIPAIFKPKFRNLNELRPCLLDTDLVLLVANSSTQKGYPIRILNFHIAVNDTLGADPILVTYSPLAQHYAVYSRTVKSEPLEFGVSGDLYKNSDLLFDTKTETLWSQLNGKALVGNMIGAKLNELDYKLYTVAEVAEKFPNLQVLSFETGNLREYATNPFQGFNEDDTTIAPPLYTSKELPAKAVVLGFNYLEKTFAVAKATLVEGENKFSKEGITVVINKTSENYSVFVNGNEVKPDILYWYVWYDLNPATVLLQTV